MMPNASKPSAYSRLFTLVLAVAAFAAAVLPSNRAEAAPPPSITLRWRGNVSSDFLNPANWVNTSTGLAATGISPFFLFNNDLLFSASSTANRRCEFFPPQGMDPISNFDYRNQSIFVNSITIENWAVSGDSAVFHIKATPQCRNGDPDCIVDGTPIERDFAAIATNALTIGGGILQIEDSSFFPGGGAPDTSSVAQVICNGPVTMSGGVLNLVHNNSFLDSAQATLTIVSRRDMMGNVLAGAANKGSFNWSGGTINYSGGEVTNDRRSSLTFEGDWTQTGGTVGTANGVVAFTNVEAAQTQVLTASGTGDKTARFPALQVTAQPLVLASGNRINCKGSFFESGGSKTISLLTNSTLNLTGQAGASTGDDITMESGMAIGPSATAALIVGDNRRVKGNGGALLLQGGIINISGSSAIVDIAGSFFSDVNTYLVGARGDVRVTGTNAQLKIQGWNVNGEAADPGTSRFRAEFGNNTVLSLMGGNPSNFITRGFAEVVWPETVSWGNSSDVIPNTPNFDAEWIVGPRSDVFQNVIIKSTTHALNLRQGLDITVPNLTIEAGGKLDVENPRTLNVLTDISNLGLMTPQGGGRIIGPDGLFQVLVGGSPVDALNIGDTFTVFVSDSDKNLDGQARDTLRNPANLSQAFVKVEVFSQGALAETEVMNGDIPVRGAGPNGPNTMAESGNANFQFTNTGFPIAMRVNEAGSDSVDNDGAIRAVGGDTIRVTYTDPNGDQRELNIPVEGAPDGLAFPDLIIENFALADINGGGMITSGQTVTYSMTIKNVGTAPNNPTTIGLFADRSTPPVAGLTPDFTIDLERVSPFLAADTMQLVGQNDDTMFTFPLEVANISAARTAPSWVQDSNMAAVVLPAKTLPLKTPDIQSAGVTWTGGGAITLTPSAVSTLTEPLEFASDPAFTARATLLTSAGTTVTAQRSTTASQGTTSAQLNLQVDGTPGRTPGVNIALAATHPLVGSYSLAELQANAVRILVDIRGSAGITTAGTHTEIRAIDSDGDIFTFRLQNDGALGNGASFTLDRELTFASQTVVGDGIFDEVVSLDLVVNDGTGKAMTGSVLFDKVRLIELNEQPELVIETGAGARLLTLRAFSGNGNRSLNPGALGVNVPLRARLDSKTGTINIPASTLTFTDQGGKVRNVTLPAVNITGGQQSVFWIAAHGATFAGNVVDTVPNFNVPIAAGSPAVAPSVRLETADAGNSLLTFTGNDGTTNLIAFQGPLGAKEPISVIVNGGNNGENLVLPTTNLTIQDENANLQKILIPSINVSPNQIVRYWISLNGSTYTRLPAHGAIPTFTTLVRGMPLVQSLTVVNLTAGTTYYIAVDGKRLGTGIADIQLGNYVLGIAEGDLVNGRSIGGVTLPEIERGPTPPANDDTFDFEQLAFQNGAAFGNNTGATAQASEPFHANNRGGASVWYGYTPSQSGPHTIHTLTSAIDTLLAIYTAPNPELNVQKVINSHPFNTSLLPQQAWAFVDIEDTNEEFTGESNNAAGPIVYTIAIPPDFLPDLVVDNVSATVNPTTQKLSLDITVRNGGPAAASASSAAIFFNRASAPTSGAGADTTSGIPALNSGDTFQFTVNNITRPTGTFNAWVFADTNLSVAELNENNNAGGPAEYTIEPLPTDLPDFRVDSVDVSVNGTQVTYTVVVSNIGTNNAPLSSLSFFNNRNTPPIQSTLANGSEPIPALPVPAFPLVESKATIVHVVNLDPGTYTSWVFADQPNLVNEVTDTNNILASTQFAVGAGGGDLPDLVVANLNAEIREDSVVYSVQVINVGSQPSGPSDVAIFFHIPDPNVDDMVNFPPASGSGADVVLDIPGLGAGDATGVTLEYETFDPPVGEPLVAWAFADSRNSVQESNGGNNVSTREVYGFPNPANHGLGDLVVDSLTAQSLGGGRVQFAASVSNDGENFTEAARMGFFHHLLRAPTGSDNSLFFPVTGIETDNANNNGTPGSWNHSGPGSAGVSIILNSSLAFEGDKFVQQSVNWTSGQRVVLEYFLTGAPQDWTQSTTLDFAATFDTLEVPTRNQRVAVRLGDSNGTFALSPSIFVNELWPDTGSYSVDLKSFTVTSAGADGDLDLNAITRLAFFTFRDGQSGTQYNMWFDGLQRSTTAQIPPLEPLTNPLLPNQSVLLSFIRDGFLPGTYKAWVFVDIDEDIQESSEKNNAGGAGGSGANSGASYTIPGGAGLSDLRATTFTVEDTTENVKMHTRLRNDGPNPITADFTVGLYTNRPTSPLINPNGTVLLPPDRTVRVTATIPVADPGSSGGEVPVDFTPFILTGGFRRPWIVIDTLNEVSESNEGNNILGLTSDPSGLDDGTFQVISVSDNGPDLTVSLNAEVDGFDVKYIATVRNEGTLSSFPAKGAIFYSLADQPIRPDNPDGVFDVPGLNPDEEKVVSFTLNGLPFGSYRSWAFVDNFLAVNEGNESNNASGDPVNFTLPDGSVMVGDLPDYRVTRHAVVGNCGKFDLEVTVRNINLEDATVPSVLFYELRNVNTAEAQDFVAAIVPPLAAGASFNCSFSTASLNGGTYSLTAICDQTNVIVEFDEFNNRRGPTENQSNGCGRGARGETIIAQLDDPERGEIGPIGGEPPDTPDLLIDSVNRVTAGNGVAFLVSVRNDSPVATTAFSRLGVFFDAATPPKAGDKADAFVNIPPLGGDESTVLTYLLTNVAAGTYQAYFVVDVDDEIDELIENNNTSSDGGGEGGYTIVDPPAGLEVDFLSTPVFSLPVDVQNPTSSLVPRIDVTGLAGGRTNFSREFLPDPASPTPGVEIKVVAPATYQGRNFVRWVNADDASDVFSVGTEAIIFVTDGLRIQAEYDGGAILITSPFINVF